MDTSKRVLFISYDGLTDPLGQAQILPYLVGLSKKGHHVTVLSCEKQQNFKKNSRVVIEKTSSAKIHWEYTHYENKYPIISPALNTRRLRKKARQILKTITIDIVHCRSIIPAGIGYGFSKKYRVKVIFDIRGFWADERVDGKIWNLKNPLFRVLYHYFKLKEKKLFERVDAIVTLTENARNYIETNFKTRRLFSVVPCCVDFDHFDLKSIRPEGVRTLKADIGISKESYVLAYIGSLGTRYMLEEMLYFFKKLKEQRPDASFLFVSKSNTSGIKELCQKVGVDFSSIYITSCEYSEIPLYISLGDVSIFFIVSSFSGKAVSPTKQAEVMSLGLPIVANSGLGDTDSILQKTNNGVVLKGFSDEEYSRGVEKLLQFNKPKEEIRADAMRLFNLQSGIEQYHCLYEKL